MSESLWPHGQQHTRPSCPPPTPGAGSNSCPLSQWCHPAISSSVVPFSSCPQSFPASGSFPVSQLFASGGQSTGTSASAPVLPMDIQTLLGPSGNGTELPSPHVSILGAYKFSAQGIVKKNWEVHRHGWKIPDLQHASHDQGLQMNIERRHCRKSETD